MFGAIRDILHSEKALAGGALVIGATVLAGLGHMTIDQWSEYTKWIFGIYASGKTVTSAIAMMTKQPKTGKASKESK